ncbi:hypothetical protein [Flavobacterium notoginsengisoli]|uniref:hypothetical protein n=1 Tax=Flavobacterium notoginsengisoli TaxID=1478199 RepID=UPI0036283137
MRSINLLLFVLLLSYEANAQSKTVSTPTKDTIQETKISPITEPKPVQPVKVIICSPSRSALTQIVYVLDGKIIDKAQFGKINPNSIKSMEVLKPNEAKSIYGDQAANGAIIIITKK